LKKTGENPIQGAPKSSTIKEKEGSADFLDHEGKKSPVFQGTEDPDLEKGKTYITDVNEKQLPSQNDLALEKKSTSTLVQQKTKKCDICLTITFYFCYVLVSHLLYYFQFFFL
jgi:hypothetical protein